MTAQQLALFPSRPALPDGFRYQPDLVPAAEERALLEAFPAFPFKEFEFHGFLGRRRVVFYGWRYDFGDGKLHEAAPIPEILLPLRERAAAFAGLAPEDLPHVLVTEYTQGAAIGWHRDRAMFGDVIGVSLAAPCVFRFRRKAGAGWERASLTLAPRSIYLMRGPSRTEWEHSIPGVDALRYSVTFRTLRDAGRL
ncbi:MAG TPA: alpha-ketoglutarate-dependent dioxygenase AlkB [Acetobacteraceae bacterium]|nr:alpha-ketoglutarate-dependent dioxygenase AlkB [Acetobacteraceae bacterium]